MFNRILSLVLFISPLLYVNGNSIDLGDLKAFPVYFSFLLIAAMMDFPKRKIQWKYISFFILACFVNLFLTGFNSFVLSSYVNLMMAMGIIALIMTYCDDLKMCWDWMIYAGIVNCIIFALQWLGFSPIIQNPVGEWGGIMGNAPRLGIYLTLLLPIVFFKKKYREFGIFVLAGIIAKEFFVILMALICLFSKIRRWWKAVAFLFILSVLFFFRQDLINSFSIRWTVWKPTIEAIFSNPVRGFGLGTFSFFADQFIKPTLPHYLELNHAENAYSSMMQFVYGMGLGGVLLVYFAIQYFIKNFKSNVIHYSILALIILSTVEYPFEIIKLWPTICALVGFYIISTRQEGLC